MDIKARILLAEDDYHFGTTLKKKLEENGYEVNHCVDGELAWKQFQKKRYDLCLLDVVMPKKDGFEVAKLIRRKSDKIPIIFISARADDDDKINGFRHGGDNYLTKPFSFQELLLRINVFIRRTNMFATDHNLQYAIGSLTFNYTARKLFHKGTMKANLTPREANVLRFLCTHPNKMLKREELLLHIWGKDDYWLGRSMDVFITKIRKFIKEEKDVKLETVHGVGFIFKMKGADT